MSLAGSSVDRPHYRRRTAPTGPPPRSRRRTWVVVLGVGVGILASVAALAVGTYVLGTFASIPPQTSAGGIPNAPTGVSFPLAEALIVNGTTVPATGNCTASNLGTAGSPTSLSSGNKTAICLNFNATGGFHFGDLMYTLVLAWNSSAANATVFEVQVSIGVTPTGPTHNITGVTSYVKTSTHITSTEEAIFAVDLTQAGDFGVTQFSVLVTQL